MSLVWHIVRKDFRRLRWPLLLWLLLPLGQWTLLAIASRTAMSPSAFDGMSTMSRVWEGLTWSVGLILAAWLVMEDGLVSTQAWWRTRPIQGARLLAAKMVGAALMFSVLPAVAMTPLWLAAGFSARELGLAALGVATKQGLFTVLAFALACVTETAGQFLVRLIGAALLVPLTLGYCAGIFGGAPGYSGDGLLETRYRLVVGVCALIPFAMVAYQYLTFRRSRSYVILAAGVTLMFALQWGWQWDLSSWFRKFPTEQVARNQVITFTSDPLALVITPTRPAKLQLHGTTSGAPEGTYISFDSARGWWSEGAGRRPGAKFSREILTPPPKTAVRQAAGLGGPAADPMPWDLIGYERDETLARARANADRYEIAVTANIMRGRVVGELPLRKGAVFQSGSARIRIIDLERTGGRLVVSLEERMAWPPWSARAEDGFVLLNPAIAPEPEVIVTAGIWPLEFNGIALRQRQLTLDMPAHEVHGQIVEIPGWEETARLVQVRFTPGERFTRVMPVTVPAMPAP